MLGDTEVTRIGLGTNRLSHTPENVQFVREAVSAGIEMIDTANGYVDGESEATIGEALESTPGTYVVATKGGYKDGQASPEGLRSQIEESLKRLRRDTIDLYYLHKPDADTPIEQSVGAIEEYRQQGAIRYVGVSNVSLEQVEKAREAAPIVAVQNHYNHAERSSDEIVDYCAENDIAFVPYFPLRETSGAAETIAERHAATAAQVTLAWLLQRSPAMLPIPGTLSIDHVVENLGALQIQLSDEELEALS